KIEDTRYHTAREKVINFKVAAAEGVRQDQDRLQETQAALRLQISTATAEELPELQSENRRISSEIRRLGQTAPEIARLAVPPVDRPKTDSDKVITKSFDEAVGIASDLPPALQSRVPVPELEVRPKESVDLESVFWHETTAWSQSARISWGTSL